eukprot:TRINITY_DN15043_c0_g3_i3.p1 TRINITY_DN15043_c0_g3~~TRINITY_DN15043_c0_g3_i3.p1  ORF type:complete len:1159 (-),score=279.96 TRINITY_DN15043_c0_g3_i3:60-3536(-)
MAAATAAGQTYRSVVEAAQASSVDVALAMVEQGFDVNEQDSEGNTALHWACWFRADALLARLLERGARPEICNASGETAAHWAAKASNVYALGATTRGRPGLLSVRDCDGFTPFIICAQIDNGPLMEWMYLEGVNVEEQDDYGRTALQWACYKGHRRTAQWLLSRSASVAHRDHEGMTAIHWAALKGHEHIAEMLLDVGAVGLLSVPDMAGDTPIALAMRKKNRYLVFSFHKSQVLQFLIGRPFLSRNNFANLFLLFMALNCLVFSVVLAPGIASRHATIVVCWALVMLTSLLLWQKNCRADPGWLRPRTIYSQDRHIGEQPAFDFDVEQPIESQMVRCENLSYELATAEEEDESSDLQKLEVRQGRCGYQRQLIHQARRRLDEDRESSACCVVPGFGAGADAGGGEDAAAEEAPGGPSSASWTCPVPGCGHRMAAASAGRRSHMLRKHKDLCIRPCPVTCAHGCLLCVPSAVLTGAATNQLAARAAAAAAAADGNAGGSKGSLEAQEKEANALAAQILAEGRRPTWDDVEAVLDVLFAGKHPKQNRFSVNPVNKRCCIGGSLGAAGFHRAHLKVQNFCWERVSDVAKLLNRFRDAERGLTSDEDDDVRATTIQVNLDFQGKPHVDGNNVGPSDIAGAGEFEHGELFVEDKDGDVEREVLGSFGGKGSTGVIRIPGIYRGKLWDVRRKWVHFNASIRLHFAEKSVGKRYTLVWFSIAPHWLKRLTAEDLATLRDNGFRPRSGAELDNLPELRLSDEGLSNDLKRYTPGFLYFSRQHRAQVERDCTGSATEQLRQMWDDVQEGNEKGQRGYYAGLERIEKESVKATKGKGAKADGKASRASVAAASSPLRMGFLAGAIKTEPGVVKSEQASSSSSAKAALPLVEVEDESCDTELDDDADDQEDEEDAIEDPQDDFDLEALSDLVQEQFPQALGDLDLFISVLEEFGIARDAELRARAYEQLERRRGIESDAALARRLSAGTEDGGERGASSSDAVAHVATPDRSQSQISCIVVEDSQGASPAPGSTPLKEALEQAAPPQATRDSSPTQQAPGTPLQAEEPARKRLCFTQLLRRPPSGGCVDIDDSPPPESPQLPSGPSAASEGAVSGSSGTFGDAIPPAAYKLMEAGLAENLLEATSALQAANFDVNAAAQALLSRGDS